MKLLHTADWHVGKTLQGRARLDEYEAVLAEISDIARAEEVDAILVAGDLFDSASPAPTAEKIVYDALLELRSIAPVVLVSGNHDSYQRLGAMAPLFARADIQVRAGLDLEPLRFDTPGGKLEIACIPWLSQRFIVKALSIMNKDAAQRSGDFIQRMEQVIDAVTSKLSSDAVRVLLTHLTITNAELGGGERQAQTIFDYWIPATLFPKDLHYVALGHIHKGQQMPGPCPIWYPGSPMHLDFSDGDDSKSVLVVEADPSSPAVARRVELASGRKLRTITGTFAQLEGMGDQGEDFLRVIVTEQARVGLADEVREIFPNAVKIRVDSQRPEDDAVRVDRTEISPHELFTLYLESRGVDDERLVKLFDELYEAAS